MIVLAKASSKLPDQTRVVRIPSPIKEEVPFQNINVFERTKNMVMGPKTKNDCAGEEWRQITALLRTVRKQSLDRKIWVTGPKTKNDWAGNGQQQFTRQDSQTRSFLTQSCETEKYDNGSSRAQNKK
jgi:hypothetical protein